MKSTTARPSEFTHERRHLDVHRGISERIDLLLEQMTVREKCFQLTAMPQWFFMTPDGSEPANLRETLAKAPGHVSNFGLDDPAQLAGVVGLIQRQAIERTRLGIPLLFHAEALNGFLAGGHMVFPTGTGLAATWSPDLVQEMADVIRRQMRRVGVRQALAPVMDVALDPRWGRVHETYGEDPYLAAAMSVAFTRGLQGDDLTQGVLATAKHFLGYSLAEAGINLSSTEFGPRRMRDLFAYPFEAAIQLAGLGSVMNSYADVDRVPVGASREILTDLLRGVLGFDGFVASDYMTLEHLVNRQRAASGAAEAGRLAIAAGMDVENPMPFGYGDVLAAEIESGRADAQHLDDSVRRVLAAKFRLGLFENPYPQEKIDIRMVASEGRELSEELARRSVVLAKNTGILPLAPSGLKVLVVGPHADAVALQFPTYTYPAWREMTTRMSSGALGNMVGLDPGMATWNDSLLPEISTEAYVRDVLDAEALGEAVDRYASSVEILQGATLTTDLEPDGIGAAVAAAREADLVILALGGASLWFNGERTEGEASDSADIALPASQVRLAEAVASVGTPYVAALFQGRAYTLPPVVQQAAAIVIAPYGGPHGSRAVADVLFGKVNPSGKLPYSVPLHTGQIPVYHHQPSGTGYRNSLPPGVDNLYLDMPATPLYAFGHGLTYTSFDLTAATSDLRVDTSETARISVTLSNTGSRPGAVVAQLYVRVNTSGATRPAQQLAGFARVELADGESRALTFHLDAAQLGYTNIARDFAVEPASVDWFIGFDSDDRRVEGSFELTGPTRILTSAERTFLCRVDDEEVRTI